jgi:hypothetical protein
MLKIANVYTSWEYITKTNKRTSDAVGYQIYHNISTNNLFLQYSFVSKYHQWGLLKGYFEIVVPQLVIGANFFYFVHFYAHVFHARV